jgi:hypothetical protein
VPAGFASLITIGFPVLFAEFLGEQLTSLCYASRDGFSGQVEWESHCEREADPSLKNSFFR